jgi:hypothetical protein
MSHNYDNAATMIKTVRMHCPIWWLHWYCSRSFSFYDAAGCRWGHFEVDGWRIRLGWLAWRLRGLF